MKKVIFLFFLLVLVACNKDKPKAGKYWATFKYDNPAMTAQSTNIEITDVGKGSVKINGYSLKKDKKNISGEITYLPGIGSFITIDGKWKRKNGIYKYVINGTFKQLINQSAGGSTAEVTGVFEMKSL